MIKQRWFGGNVGISGHEIILCKSSKAMKTVRKDGSRQGAMKITALEPNSTLASRNGEQSPHFFATLRVGYSWLDEPVETWPENQKLHKFAHHLRVDNATTERMIQRTFLYHNYGKRSEDHFQTTLAVVGAGIAKVLT